MKKLLSMLLVLTMVVTTLMGVMVMDVNAKASIDTSTDPDTITLQFGVASLPADKPSNMNGVYGIGNWYGSGYSYSDEDLATTPDAENPITGTKTESVNFLETSKVVNPLVGDMMKYDWKAGVITDDSYKAFNLGTGWLNAVSANYSRLRILSTVTAGSIASVNTATYGTVKEEKVYQYTFYAYTDPNTTLDNKSNPSSRIMLSHTLGSSAHIDPNIYSNQVPSANGVPHKIDVVFSSDAATNYVNVYVDGVQLSAGASKANTNTKAVAFVPRFGDLSLQSGTKITLKDTDWYITLPSTVPGEGITPVTQDDVKASLVVVPNFNATTQATTYRTDDYITGVIASLDASIKGVLETTTVGDKIVDIAESKYNNPVSLFDTTVENATVKLVSRTTGEEVAPASATGTMDDYYFMVNGIYIIPNKVADPAPYVKVDKDPFQVAKHNVIDVRLLREDFENNSIPADEPAYGGLRTGFVRYTNEPRGSFYFSAGKAYYNQSGYYNAVMPGMIKRSTYASNEFKKNMTTLQFDMYIPEYTYTSDEYVRLNFAGNRNDASTSNENTRTALPGFTFTTNGKISGSAPVTSVDLVGNAWNTVTFQFDATNTPTSGNVDIIVYVNGEKQLETASTTGDYGATAEDYISFLNYARLYMPSYSSVGIMNDAWYVGDYVPTVTATTENAIDTASVSGVTVNADNENNLVIYDSSDDKDYSKLIAAMEAAGYNAVYERVVDKELVDKKYSEVDGDVTIDGYTVTGAAVKRWIESADTDKYITFTPDSDGDGKNEYTIVDTTKITSAVDNGDGTATLVSTSALQDMNVYDGVVHKANDIINMLIEEGNTAAATQTLVGFTAVNEAGKLPRIYSLQEMGTELYTLGYDETTKVANLDYREFGGTDTISFVLVVGAYDANGKLLALDVSEAMAIDSANEADGVKTKTFTADFGELDLTTVRKYKVFAFNSLAERKPIMANYAMINPAYVAPVE